MFQGQQVGFAAHPPNAQGKPHGLVDHLERVGELAARFAGQFDAAELGRWAGRWHDVGKFDPAFQRYLSAEEGGGGPDHKAAGALLALEHFSPLCFVICGHHGGLPSLHELKPWLERKRGNPIVQASMQRAMEEGAELNPGEPLTAPSWLQGGSKEQAELFIRMLYSALVDADFLDTEQHCSPENAAVRSIPHPSIRDLEELFLLNFDRAMGRRRRGASQARRAVLHKCLDAAEQQAGVFKLPIGPPADRTIYALGFALHHASWRCAERVIVVVPRRDLKDRIIDVYSCLKAAGQCLATAAYPFPLLGSPESGPPLSLKARLAAENWDAPVVVTSDAHFFQSLLANRPGPCRKLHNLCKSVVILEQFQSVPLGFLGPVTDVLNELVAHYGMSVVLATETLPALERTRLAARMASAKVVLRPRFRISSWNPPVRCRVEQASLGWHDIAERMKAGHQVLTITNCKSDALQLFDLLARDDTFHLSTLLCGAHRSRLIAEIRTRLRCRLPCLVVGTQVAEQVFPHQFPLVFRVMAPLERILLAGECCQHKRGSPGPSELIVFEPKHAGQPAGIYSSATAVTRNLLGKPGATIDSPALQNEYWRVLVDGIDQDKNGIHSFRQAFDFPAVGERFRFVRAETEPLIVPYIPPGCKVSPALKLTSRLHEGGVEPEVSRLLAGYTVPVSRKRLERWSERGKAKLVVPGVWEWKESYDFRRGIGLDDDDLNQKDTPEVALWEAA